MSTHRAKCPVCGLTLKWHSSDNPFDVIREGAEHLASHPGQPSFEELFDRAVLAGIDPQALPRA